MRRTYAHLYAHLIGNAICPRLKQALAHIFRNMSAIGRHLAIVLLSTDNTAMRSPDLRDVDFVDALPQIDTRGDRRVVLSPRMDDAETFLKR